MLIAILISHQAIESFALTVKEIAQMLQSFGTELAETELPDDMYSIERILALRTEKYYQLKVWISSVFPFQFAQQGGISAFLPCVCVDRQDKPQHDSFCRLPIR